MDRISRAMELARSQRETREESPRREKPPLEAVAADRIEPRPVSLRSGDLAPHEQRPPFEPGETMSHGPRVFTLDPKLRESERILPPGCPGAMGAPYKMLRTQVLKRLDQLGANSLAIIGATGEVGKTLTAINLAIAISADPSRTVLLVDLDLRNPSIHKRLGFQPEVGVEECLAERVPIHRAMCKLGGYERLTLLPARQRVEHSSDLLRSGRVADCVHELRARYANRVLIFDLPPVLSADDALAFSKHVQAGLVVVGEGRTQRDDLARTIDLLSDLAIVGTVLNGSRDPAQTYY